MSDMGDLLDEYDDSAVNHSQAGLAGMNLTSTSSSKKNASVDMVKGVQKEDEDEDDALGDLLDEDDDDHDVAAESQAHKAALKRHGTNAASTGGAGSGAAGAMLIAMIAFGPSCLFSFASAENAFSCSDPIPGDEARRKMCSVVESTVMIVDGCEFPCLAAQGCTAPEKYDCEHSIALTAPTWNEQECDETWQEGSGKCSAETGCPQCTPKLQTCFEKGEYLDEESRVFNIGTVPTCKKMPLGVLCRCNRRCFTAQR
jgi:hypothetical protein